MFCPKCGAKALEGAAFCQKCGTKLIIDEEPNGLSTDPAMETSQRTQAILDGQSNTPKTKIFNKRIFGLIGAGLIIVVAVVVVLALKGRTKYPDELLYDGLPVASYVRQTSAHLPSTRFSHRPLKFFFLMLVVLPCGNILPIPQKQSPKTKSSSFWGINTDGFGRCHRQKALIHRRFRPDAKSPKTPSRNITMSWGNIDFSRKGKVVFSVGLRPRLPPPW